MHSVSAAFTALQKRATNSGGKKRVTIGVTDVTAYLIKGGMSDISQTLEKELHEFISKTVTLTVSNHDDTFYNAGSTGLFDSLASEIEIEIELGLEGITDFSPQGFVPYFTGLIERDSIQRLIDNRIRFTCYGYARQLEGLQWSGSDYYRKPLKWIVEQIATQISLTLDYDVDNLTCETGNNYGKAYCEPQQQDDATVYWTVRGATSGDEVSIGVITHEDEFNIVRINHVTGEVISYSTNLATAPAGYEWWRLWYYAGDFWTLKRNTSSPYNVEAVVRIQTDGTVTQYDITQAGWDRYAYRFHGYGQYLFYFEDATGSNNVRAMRFDMGATPPAIDITGNTLAGATWETGSHPGYDPDGNRLFGQITHTGGGTSRWHHYDFDTSTWDGSPPVMETGIGDENEMGAKHSEDCFYFPDKYFNYNTEVWDDITKEAGITTLWRFREQPDGTLYCFEYGEKELRILSGGTVSILEMMDHGSRNEYEPPIKVTTDIFVGISRHENIDGDEYISPFVLRTNIIPFVESVEFEEDSLRTILQDLAKTFLCTFQVTKTHLYFWSRGKYNDTFTLGKDLYAKGAVQKQYRYYCDGLRLTKGDNQYEEGTLTFGKRILEISSDYFPAYLGDNLVWLLYQFHKEKRRLFEVFCVYLIQLMLLDKPTVAILNENVVCFIYDIRQDPRTNITRLRLLEEV